MDLLSLFCKLFFSEEAAEGSALLIVEGIHQDIDQEREMGGGL